METTVSIRRKLKALIFEKQKTCTTDKERNKAVNDARAEINAKYGKSWRELTPAKSSRNSEPSFYDGHANGEHWMD